MDKADTQEKEFGTYQVGEKTYRLAPFTVRRLEQAGGLLGEIPVEDLLNAYWEIEGKIENAVQRVKAKLPSFDPSAGSGQAPLRAGSPAITDVEGVLEEVDVDFSVTRVITAVQKVLPVLSEQGLLVKFVAVALDIDEQEAADLPAGVALEVVPDFFSANKGLLKTSLKSSLPGMILARQVTTPSTSSGQAPPPAESLDMPSTASPPHPANKTP